MTADGPKLREDFRAAANWVKSRPDSTGKLGVVGFCFGGTTTNALAVRLGSELSAAVPFYGGQPNAEDAAKIKAPLPAEYREPDTPTTARRPAFRSPPPAPAMPHQGHG